MESTPESTRESTRESTQDTTPESTPDATRGRGGVRRIGLTGGIASGKSTVCAELKALGLPIIDSDQLARDAVAPGAPLLPVLVETFGPDILLPAGSLDRARLGEKVFGDAVARARLNALIHPEVQRLSAVQVDALERAGHTLIVLDIPLLYEVRDPADFDAVVVVYVDGPTQLLRLMARNQLSEAQARARIQSQGALEDKRARAEYVIDNRGGLEETRRQVHQVVSQLRERFFGVGSGSGRVLDSVFDERGDGRMVQSDPSA